MVYMLCSAAVVFPRQTIASEMRLVNIQDIIKFNANVFALCCVCAVLCGVVASGAL